MKKLKISILFIIILLGCNRKLDNPLSTDEDLKNTPNILQINLDSDNNASIILDYSYSDSSTIILERKSIGGFETVNYIKETQTTLLDTSFDKELNHTFIYRLYVKKDIYRSSYSEEKQLIYISSGLNRPKDLIGISIELQGIQLTWEDKSNYEENYLIEKDGGSGFSALATLDADEETYFDAIPGAPQSPLQLIYRVKAVKSGLESEWVIISLSYAGIGSPTNLRITNSSPSNFRIDWQDNSNIETGYAIEKKKDSEIYSEIAQVGVNETSYSDNISELGSYSYRIRAIKDGTFSIYSNEVTKTISSLIPSDGLVAYYPFNGNANDESGNSNDGTLYNTILTTDRFDNNNSAYNFNGINSYIDLGDKTDFRFGFSNFSISLWFYSDGSSQLAPILNKRHGGGNFEQYGIYLWNDPTPPISQSRAIGAYIRPDNAPPSNNNFDRWVSSDELTQGWHFITMVNIYDQKLILYINGVEIGSDNSSLNNYSINSISYPLLLGTTINIDGAGSGDVFVKGKIDDIRIFNRHLTEEEIIFLYNEGGWSE